MAAYVYCGFLVVWCGGEILITCLPLFSLSQSEISRNGSCVLNAAIQLDQRLQRLVWVQPLMSFTS